MPNPKIIVRRISKIDPPFGPTDAVIPSVGVHFEDGQIANLRSGSPNFAFRHEALTELHRAGLPVHVEVEPQTREITNLRIPREGKVALVAANRDGDVTFHLNNSAKSFVLPSKHPKFNGFLKVLRDAHFARSSVVVTENGGVLDILDIRPSDLPQVPALVEKAGTAPAILPVLARAVPLKVARRMFRLVASKSCDPVSPSTSCIPFLYPDDGCHARAHRMCSLISGAGVTPAKIWNYPSNPQEPLIVKTRNAPGCQVKWRFHVAVALEVKVGSGKSETMIIDPSLFPDGPVAAAAWQQAQGDPLSSLMHTSPDPYLPPSPGDVERDPDGSKTAAELIVFRLDLKERAGQIPFKCSRRRATAAS